ncbi:hypothetical protein EDB83DRAFT_675603 [Lactarius deliciosus]|nr:hypothetical protein EDB83DRAFT_675603 [Lactarius deliciosus]
MPGNEDHDDSSSSGSASLGALSPDRDQDDLSADMDAAPPPLGVNLTGYRLLNMTIVFSFGITKGILTYMGQSTAPTTLDWIGGALLAVALYWIGLYEQRDAKKWEWFFQVDLAPGIDYYAKRVVGGGKHTHISLVVCDTNIDANERTNEHKAMGVLFSLRGTLAITSLSSLPVFLLAHFISHVPLDAWLGVYVGFRCLCALSLALGRPDKLEDESGDGSVRWTLWKTTDLVHRLRNSMSGSARWER